MKRKEIGLDRFYVAQEKIEQNWLTADQQYKSIMWYYTCVYTNMYNDDELLEKNKLK